MPKIKYSESLKLEVIRYVLSGNSMRSEMGSCISRAWRVWYKD